MTLCHAIYFSKCLTVDPEEVEAILTTSTRNNRRLDLTGALLFDERNFVQILEGPRSTLTTMLQTIMQDARHENLVLTLFDQIPQRSFKGWEMCGTRVTADVQQRFRDIRLPAVLQPDAMTGQEIWDMIVTVVDEGLNVEA